MHHSIPTQQNIPQTFKMMMLKNFMTHKNAHNISLGKKIIRVHTAHSVRFRFCGQPNTDMFLHVEKLLERSKSNYAEYLFLKYGFMVDIFIDFYIFQISFFSIGMNMCCFHNTFLKELRREQNRSFHCKMWHFILSYIRKAYWNVQGLCSASGSNGFSLAMSFLGGMRKQTGNSGTGSDWPLALLLIVTYKLLVTKSSRCVGGGKETKAKPSTSPSVPPCFWHINPWSSNCVALTLFQQCTSEPGQ